MQPTLSNGSAFSETNKGFGAFFSQKGVFSRFMARKTGEIPTFVGRKQRSQWKN
jgi:hypothetical protein